MARPRAFDVDASLQKAMLRFWRTGFLGTSVRDLCKEMDIRPGSFYAAFGSKEECFRRCLERYINQQKPEAPSPAAIRTWFDAIADPSRGARGCLLINSAMEMPVLDQDSQVLVRRWLRRLENYLGLCLGPCDTAQADAALLFAAMIAMLVQARAGAPSEQLRALADRAFESVGLPSERVISKARQVSGRRQSSRAI